MGVVGSSSDSVSFDIGMEEVRGRYPYTKLSEHFVFLSADVSCPLIKSSRGLPCDLLCGGILMYVNIPLCIP